MNGPYRVWVAAVLLVSAMILGGGGTLNPRNEILLQLLYAATFLALIAAYLRGPAGGGASTHRVPRMAWLLTILILALPVMQLVPLPPSIWQALPGREPLMVILAQIGEQDSWRPLSMTPDRTLASLLAMVPPVFLMLWLAGCEQFQRRQIVSLVAAVAAISVALGALQMSSGEAGGWRLYQHTHMGFLVGFQASRNAQATLLLIGLCALLPLGATLALRLGDRAGRLLHGGFALLLGTGIFLTGSRAGIVLLVVPAAIHLIAFHGAVRRIPVRIISAVIVGTGALFAIVALWRPASVSKVLGRFSGTPEGRADLWADTWFAVTQTWPAGAGMGSFIPMFTAAERLEAVDPSYPVRAHNDWLEFTLEGGLPGLLVLGVIAALLARLTLTGKPAFSAPSSEVSHASGLWLFAVGSLTVIALHSIVDYPFRSMSIACLGATAAACLFPHKNPSRQTF
ncbi:O-antigen ligase family protein [Altererythrobacter aquiaggeris]|uniref:O-antigen ligase family protein n=1 Tax=Aestuarierythrobacter aquiaggeris TaxID=1898396 RepID=UPI0030172431